MSADAWMSLQPRLWRRDKYWRVGLRYHTAAGRKIRIIQHYSGIKYSDYVLCCQCSQGNLPINPNQVSWCQKMYNLLQTCNIILPPLIGSQHAVIFSYTPSHCWMLSQVKKLVLIVTKAFQQHFSHPQQLVRYLKHLINAFEWLWKNIALHCLPGRLIILLQAF